MSSEIQIVLGLLVAVVAFASVANKVGIPYPILLVLGGLALSFIPILPEVRLAPDVVLLLFLPPLLFSAAWNTSWRDFRANTGQILLLALGLVLATTVVVAVVAHWLIPGLPLAAAFVLGAVVSPTDPVAATAIAERLGAPRRVITIVEGESLVNDAMGLVLYGFAVAAVTTGAFSILDAGLRFVLVALGGVVVGLVVGWASVWLTRRLNDAPIEITLSFLAAFAAYLLAEALSVSGVLATVSAGIFVSWREAGIMGPNTRLQATAVWNVIVFLLNGLLFVLIGLQMRPILDGLTGRSFGELLFYAALVSLTVIVVRILWIFASKYLNRPIDRSEGGGRDSEGGLLAGWRNMAVVSWSGLRGGVSLAAALAVPLFIASGTPFPQRDLIIFLTYGVILVTLVGQGLSLPALIRALGVEDDGLEEEEEAKGRIEAARSALERLDELSSEDWVRDEEVQRLREFYNNLARKSAVRSENNSKAEEYEDNAAARRRLMRELLQAQRSTLVEMRNEGRISDNVMSRIERDLDLGETRLDSG